MTGPLRHAGLLVAGLACALVAAGCSDDEPATGGGTAWPRTDAAVATDGLVWAAGNEVHLAGGSTIELEQEAGSYVVAGPGVFYFSDDTDGPPFLLATPDGKVVETDADPYGPSRTWQVPVQDFGAVPVLQPDSGKAVTTFFEQDPSAAPPLPGDPDLESWTLTGWLDDETAVGLTSTTDPHPLPVLLTCVVPSGRCEVVEGAEDGVSLPVDRPTGLPPVYP